MESKASYPENRGGAGEGPTLERCLTCADYYQVWNQLKGKLSVFVTGADTVDMLGMMMIGADGAQAGIMALGRHNWSRFISLSLEGKYTEARNI